jgi:hypothetical protein
MINFSELNITVKEPPLIGQRIDVNDVIDAQIEVHKHIVKPSKFIKPGREPKDCLHLQIKYEGKFRVIFVPSKNLIEQISQVPGNKFPFQAKIIKIGKGLQFS